MHPSHWQRIDKLDIPWFWNNLLILAHLVKKGSLDYSSIDLQLWGHEFDLISSQSHHRVTDINKNPRYTNWRQWYPKVPNPEFETSRNKTIRRVRPQAVFEDRYKVDLVTWHFMAKTSLVYVIARYGHCLLLHKLCMVSIPNIYYAPLTKHSSHF